MFNPEAVHQCLYMLWCFVHDAAAAAKTPQTWNIADCKIIWTTCFTYVNNFLPPPIFRLNRCVQSNRDKRLTGRQTFVTLFGTHTETHTCIHTGTTFIVERATFYGPKHFISFPFRMQLKRKQWMDAWHLVLQPIHNLCNGWPDFSKTESPHNNKYTYRYVCMVNEKTENVLSG